MKIRVFQAGKGDCLLLRSGDGTNILVDGGLVSRTHGDFYSPTVAPRLAALERAGERLALVCVSHIDQDHIGGVLRLLNDHFDWRVFKHQDDQGLDPDRPDNDRPPPIDDIWHNSFHEQVDMNEVAIGDAIAAAVPGSIVDEDAPRPGHGDNFLEDLATSMKEAAQLSRRIGADQLGIDLNRHFGGRLAMKRPDSLGLAIGGFNVSVIGPTGPQLQKLREEWQKWLESEKGIRQIAAVQRDAAEDEDLLANGRLEEFLRLNLLGPAIGNRAQVTEENVASIIMLVAEGGQNILLTGDARDDDIVDSLKGAGIADAEGHVHLNVLKVQHHGSENNFSTDFAKKVTADHYLICGNGQHHNPDFRVIKTLIDSRLGSASQRSPNPEVGNRFKVWFSADADSPGADSTHMQEVERRVRQRAEASAGQMRFRFNRHSTFSFDPKPP